jgi:hypothetical protein
MGTIVPRKRKNGSQAYRAQIVRKQGGKIVYRETQTFDRKQAAKAWLDRREKELREPGALALSLKDPPLRDVIDRYIRESAKIGRTKKRVLRTIKDKHDIAEIKCFKIRSEDLVAFAQSLPVKPQTRQNYLSHLGAVFAVARPAWGYQLDRNLMKDPLVVTRKLGVTRKSDQRDRRPTHSMSWTRSWSTLATSERRGRLRLLCRRSRSSRSSALAVRRNSAASGSSLLNQLFMDLFTLSDPECWTDRSLGQSLPLKPPGPHVRPTPVNPRSNDERTLRDCSPTEPAARGGHAAIRSIGSARTQRSRRHNHFPN